MEDRSLPVVQQEGAWTVGIPAADDVAADELVELVAHTVQPLVGPCEHGFRRCERIAGAELPAEVNVVDADLCAGHFIQAYLDHLGMVAAVHQCKATNFAVELVGTGPYQCHERIVLGAACAARAVNALEAGHQRTAVDHPFPRPRAGKRDQFPIGIIEVHAGTHYTLQRQDLAAFIDDLCAAGDDVAVIEHRIQQGHAQPQNGIRVINGQGTAAAFMVERGGQALERRLFVSYGMSPVNQVDCRTAVCRRELQCTAAQVSVAVGWIFLRQLFEFQRVVAQIFLPAFKKQPVERGTEAFEPRAPVNMRRQSVARQAEDVAHTAVAQMK